MKVIYHCYGGSHSSIIAASIHVGILPRDRIPKEEELFACPLFDQGTPESHGIIHLIGSDEDNNNIYSMGCRNAFPIIESSLKGAMEIFRLNPRELYFVDTLPCVNIEMRIGGFLSRQLRLISTGRPLVVKGSQKAFFNLAKLVQRVKVNLKERR